MGSRRAMLMTTQEKVAAGMSGEDVKVTFDSRRPIVHIPTKNIRVPPPPEEVDEETEINMRSWIDHESSHIRFGTSPWDYRIVKDKVMKNLCFALEDCRVDRKNGEKYAGTKDNRRRGFDLVRPKMKVKNILQAAYYVLYEQVKGYFSLEGSVQYWTDRLKEPMAALGLAQMMLAIPDLVERLKSVETQGEVISISEQIKARWKKLFKSGGPGGDGEQENKMTDGGAFADKEDKKQQDKKQEKKKQSSGSGDGDPQESDDEDDDDSGDSSGGRGNDEKKSKQDSDDDDLDDGDGDTDEKDDASGGDDEDGDDSDGADDEDSEGGDEGDDDEGDGEEGDNEGGDSKADGDRESDDEDGDGEDADSEDDEGSADDSEDEDSDDETDKDTDSGSGDEDDDEDGSDSKSSDGEEDDEDGDEKDQGASGDDDEEDEQDDGGRSTKSDKDVDDEMDDMMDDFKPVSDAEQEELESRCDDSNKNQSNSDSRRYGDCPPGYRAFVGRDIVIDLEPKESGLLKYNDDGTMSTNRRGDVVQVTPAEFKSEVHSKLGTFQRRLMRALMARRKLWVKDRERGSLDDTRLYRVGYGDKRVCKQKLRRPSLNIAITILLDMSGSMAGFEQYLCAQLGYILGETCSLIRIPFEVLGFTTGSFFGSPSRYNRSYRGDGDQAQVPGVYYHRTNNLQLIVIKPFEMTKRSDMLNKMYAAASWSGGGTTEGEAIWWAAKRLSLQRTQRRLLVTMCDGAPNGNPAPHWKFEEHVTHTLERIQRAGIETLHVGIGTDAPKRYVPEDAFVRYDGIDSLITEFAPAFADILLRERLRNTPPIPMH